MTGPTDPLLTHPDIREIDRRLRERLDAVLAAELAAAATRARRSASLRDRLLEFEDANTMVTVRVGDTVATGRPLVGADHIEIVDGTISRMIPIDAIDSLTVHR